ncbi:MAG: hypothetical protein ACPG4Q_14670 [Phycisphaeraceae bacterium]|jgi:hypothetical protein
MSLKLETAAMTKMMSRSMMLMLTAGLLMGTVGCKGTDSRRVPVDESTRAELDDQRQLPVTLIEFRESASADILQALPTARGISDTPERVTILLGDINNKTTSMSTNDYEYVVSGIRSNLIRTKAAGDKMKFVEERRRVENIASKERVATDPAPADAAGEEIKWGGGSFYVPDYDAKLTYGMFMDVYEIRRSESALYYIEVQLVSFATNEIIYSFRTETKQVMDR